ncbi:MAG: hypothetical protein HZC55_04360 [Verrucomicrobia bacterium]|nr:hypothetical protein [Verrucomicrobiota bacterium]
MSPRSPFSVRRLGAGLLPVVLSLILPAGRAQGVPEYEKPPVSYSETAPADGIARLQRRLAAGELVLRGSEREVLAALLRELRVPVASQVVVFSKTSLQRGRIRPQRPRVLYFSDTTYVGWVPGGLIELTAVDPQLGPVFYAFDLPALAHGPAKIARDGECLSCHGGSFVRDVPGVFVRSVFPAETGEPLLRFGTQVVDDQTPFTDRWGGWYVTGYHGATPHRGNAFAAEVEGQLRFEPATVRPDELSAFFDPGPYLAPTSDVVALLVLEHQTAVQNALTRAAFAARKMIAYQRGLQKHFKEAETDEPVYDSVKSVFQGVVQDVVDRLLLRNEARLPEGITGDPAFREAFAGGSHRTAGGRSLRELDLQGRLFVHRCSYLIYSEMFAALPEPLLARIFARLRAALESTDPKDRYAYLPAEERQRVLAILRETHPEAARRWGGAAPVRRPDGP